MKTTDDRVPRAAENNARWCDLVCRSHGIPTTMQPGLWAASRRTPELYPDAVTLLPDANAENVLGAVEDGPGCSVKDSFADLDLGAMDFEELFEASWIFREAEAGSSGSGWGVVETETGFEEWTRAAGLVGTLRGDLLRDPSVRFLVARGPDGVAAGAIANQTGSIVGVSNVFCTTLAADEAWVGLVDALAVVFPSLPLVGYERGDELHAALASGFTEIGPLRVWLRITIGEG